MPKLSDYCPESGHICEAWFCGRPIAFNYPYVEFTDERGITRYRHEGCHKFYWTATANEVINSYHAGEQQRHENEN